MNDPETYWEDRARETENTLRRVCDILVRHGGYHMRHDLGLLRDAWQDVITKLDTDWKAAERLHEAMPDTREPECVKRWPECESGGYDPRCCRWPKSCSCG